MNDEGECNTHCRVQVRKWVAREQKKQEEQLGGYGNGPCRGILMNGTIVVAMAVPSSGWI